MSLERYRHRSAPKSQPPQARIRRSRPGCVLSSTRVNPARIGPRTRHAQGAKELAAGGEELDAEYWKAGVAESYSQAAEEKRNFFTNAEKNSCLRAHLPANCSFGNAGWYAGNRESNRGNAADSPVTRRMRQRKSKWRRRSGIYNGGVESLSRQRRSLRRPLATRRP